MGKVKITQEQAKEIEERKKTNLLDLSIIHHVNGRWEGATNYVLNDLTLDEFIRALYIGYEVEPEFKVGDIVNDGYGAVLKIAAVEENGITLYTNHKNTVQEWFGNKTDDYKRIRHATDVEVELYKQRRFWQDNGREVWELKKGDVLSKDKRKMSTVNWVDSLGVSFNEFGFFAIWHEVKKYYKIACFAHDRKDLKND